MKFSLSWLKDHLETDASAETIADRLINIGLEVEELSNPAEALAPFRVPMPPRPAGDPEPLDYLRLENDDAFAIQLEATLSTEKMREQGLAPHVLSRGTASAAMYWSAAQIVTHHASNGCNLQPGDLIGTGTLSTDSDTGLGSLLEISRGGKKPVDLPSGETRSFLEDGDEVTLRAWCEAEGAVRIGFGECVGRVVPRH